MPDEDTETENLPTTVTVNGYVLPIVPFYSPAETPGGKTLAEEHGKEWVEPKDGKKDPDYSYERYSPEEVESHKAQSKDLKKARPDTEQEDYQSQDAGYMSSDSEASSRVSLASRGIMFGVSYIDSGNIFASQGASSSSDVLSPRGFDEDSVDPGEQKRYDSAVGGLISGGLYMSGVMEENLGFNPERTPEPAGVSPGGLLASNAMPDMVLPSYQDAMNMPKRAAAAETPIPPSYKDAVAAPGKALEKAPPPNYEELEGEGAKETRQSVPNIKGARDSFFPPDTSPKEQHINKPQCRTWEVKVRGEDSSPQTPSGAPSR